MFNSDNFILVFFKERNAQLTRAANEIKKFKETKTWISNSYLIRQNLSGFHHYSLSSIKYFHLLLAPILRFISNLDNELNVNAKQFFWVLNRQQTHD